MFPPTRFRSCLRIMVPLSKNKFLTQQYSARRPFRRNLTVGNNYSKVQVKSNKWITWRGLITRWIPLGSVMYIGWCYIRSTVSYDVSDIEIKCYEKLPFRITSRLWGKLASYELPIPLRNFVYGTYIKMFKVNLEEAEVTDLKLYKSISDFFTRSLKSDARDISADCCVSPCDGKILSCGPSRTDRIEQVKGVTYSLENFLGENIWSRQNGESYYNSLLKNKENILHHCTIYLAPGDYHRFHSPCDWTAKYRRHFSGKLLSVNPWIASIVPDLFVLNERAVYVGEWEHGFFSMTAVGATNVGSIQIYSDEELNTNKGKANTVHDKILKPVYRLQKGELFGQFNMGSTIVLLFEAPRDFKFSFRCGEKIFVGQALGCTAAVKNTAS